MPIRIPFLALLIAAAAPLPALAGPMEAVVARAVAAPGRPADMVALDAGRQPAKVLDFLGLKPGERVLDFAAGGGYYTEILARSVGPKGMVIGFEHPSFVEEEKARKGWEALLARQKNARLMSVPIGQFAAAPNSFDFVLFHLVYHDLYWESEKYKYPRIDPARVLSMLFSVVKPGGIVGVVDHVGPAGDTREVVEKFHRIDPETIKADFAKAGFVLDGESDLLRNPGDAHDKLVFDPAIRGKTDRVILRFRKPG
ncbi:class I SAM-dependent methyltransferase [Flavisphingomonas formosensis]|uniref:class I SAM-dependent methyltransferase n=1 Tax=Flavisphingomonas formosensis TaxID=861534 RepID=UPI001E4285C8|nr:methyltransferase domain-containing protein [Sphingomonas formosensis]